MGYKEIPLSGKRGVGKVTLVSEEDFEWASKINWRFDKDGYAIGHCMGSSRHLHRLILDPPEHLMTHHINHDKLDNRRENLMAVTNRENQILRAPGKRKSVHPGVVFDPTSGKPYVARIMINGRRIHLGRFNTADEAGEAYRRYLASERWERGLSVSPSSCGYQEVASRPAERN